MISHYIPISAALSALAKAGHTVSRNSNRAARIAGFGGQTYVIDGQAYGLSAVRAMAAELVTPKAISTNSKPKREIDIIAEAIAADEWCQAQECSVCTMGVRQLNGQVTYMFRQTRSDGRKVCKGLTLRDIRSWAKRNQVINPGYKTTTYSPAI